jgi:hypothetical protein
MVGPFIFRCPATGLNVQHVFEDEVPEIGIERRYGRVMSRPTIPWLRLVANDAKLWALPEGAELKVLVVMDRDDSLAFFRPKSYPTHNETLTAALLALHSRHGGTRIS